MLRRVEVREVLDDDLWATLLVSVGSAFKSLAVGAALAKLALDPEALSLAVEGGDAAAGTPSPARIRPVEGRPGAAWSVPPASRSPMAAMRASDFVSVIAFSILAAAAPPAEPEPEPGPGQGSNVADVAALLEAHNRERARKDLPPLVLNPKLEAAALAHSRDMAYRDKMTHEGGDGSTPAQRIERQDYHFRGVAENVAAGQPGVAEVLKSWMDSPPHRKNILGDFTELGAAAVKSEDGTPYWTVTFGLPSPKLDPARASAQVLEEINRARTKAGKPSLKAHPKLQAAAREHAREMAMPEDSGDRDGEARGPFQQLEEAGYRFRRIAELTAAGQPTPEEVVRSLLEKRDNREAILGDFGEAGVGCASAEKGMPYWSVILAKPRR